MGLRGWCGIGQTWSQFDLCTIGFIPETAGIEMNEIPIPGEEAYSDAAAPADRDRTAVSTAKE
jgi:hypothetical protein